MSVSQPDNGGTIFISCTHDGVEQRITFSVFNAWRIFGMLAFLLGAPLSAKLKKEIKLG